MLDFIRTIRASDKQTKKKWLFIFSSVGIALALAVWVVSFKAILRSITSPEILVKDTGTTTEGLGERFKHAFNEFGGAVSRSVGNLRSALSKDRIPLTKSTSSNQ